MRTHNPCTNEKGFVLVAGLVFVAILTILGTTAYMTTSSDLQVAYNYRKAREAFYGAEGGAHEARYRLRPGVTGTITDTASPKNANWCVYIVAASLGGASWNPNPAINTVSGDPEYNAFFTNTVVASLQTHNPPTNPDIPYWVKVRHKREWDAIQAGHTTALPHYQDHNLSVTGITAASRGSIIYYGLQGTSTNRHYTTAGTTDDPPAEIITATFVQ